jgi:hypothetical protein
LLSTVVLVVLLWVSVTDVGDLNLSADAVLAGSAKCVNTPWKESLDYVGTLARMDSLHSWLGYLTGFSCAFVVGAVLLAFLPFLKFVKKS